MKQKKISNRKISQTIVSMPLSFITILIFMMIVQLNVVFAETISNVEDFRAREE